jgi:DNA-binding NtrC family response regulator
MTLSQRHCRRPWCGKHVLVADDELQVRQFLRKVLEAYGCVVQEAENGLAAAECARAGSVDLVITDLWMPVMNGVELIEAFESMGCPAEVIIISAHLTSSSTDKLRGLGAFRVLKKPVDISALLKAVGAGLRSDRRGRLAGELRGQLRSRACSEHAEQAKVLVADDDDCVRGFLRDALSRAGYCVEEATDGEEAVVKARAHDINLVLMDLNMPRVGGRQAMEKLSQTSRNCFVICLTGESTQREMDDALRAGAASCFRKPFDLKALIAEVERLSIIVAHRRRQEQRQRAGSAHVPFLARMRARVRSARRRYGRRLKWMVAAVVATVALSGATVPLILSVVGAASRATRSASERAGEALESASRVEGYLRRDEARELSRGRF